MSKTANLLAIQRIAERVEQMEPTSDGSADYRAGQEFTLVRVRRMLQTLAHACTEEDA